MKNTIKKRQTRKNRKKHIFFTFLFISTILWTISKLSKHYTHSIKLKTKYVNLTNDKELQNKAVEKLDVVMKTTGFNLMMQGIFEKEITIDLSNLQQKKERYYYVTNSNLAKIQSQLSSDKNILKITPDTLFFDFGKLSTKKIKVIPKLDISYKVGHSIVGNISIDPKTITINGSETDILNINSISTKMYSLANVTNDFEFQVALDIPKEYHKIHFSTNEVTIKGVVEKYTEASLQVPFELINVPNNYSIKTFVDKVNVTYKVSLNNYDKIICDFNRIDSMKSTFLIPEIIKKPNLVSNIKINPMKVEFLIKK